jgi:hypothetical protein
MTTWASEVDKLFGEARKVFGTTFTIAGTDYKGVMLDSTELLPLLPGGFPEDFAGGLEIKTTDVDPAVGTKLTIQGKTLRIESKGSVGEDNTAVLILVGVSK